LTEFGLAGGADYDALVACASLEHQLPLSFGDALFHGSMGNQPLHAPIVGMATDADSQGYWLVGSDGGIFTFGDASFHGSMGATKLAAPMVGVSASSGGGGYWLAASDGGIFSFGDAGYEGNGVGFSGREVGLSS
jgi:hypothetical protein